MNPFENFIIETIFQSQWLSIRGLIIEIVSSLFCHQMNQNIWNYELIVLVCLCFFTSIKNRKSIRQFEKQVSLEHSREKLSTRSRTGSSTG